MSWCGGSRKRSFLKPIGFPRSQSGLTSACRIPHIPLGAWTTFERHGARILRPRSARIMRGDSSRPSMSSAWGSRQDLLRTCARLTDAVYPGLDVRREIQAVDTQSLGETLLVHEGKRLVAFAVCHCGPGTEGGSGTCYVKFSAVHPGPNAPKTFDTLLDACQDLAASRGLKKVVAGANLAREEAYRAMVVQGFRTAFQGVAMERGRLGYNRPGVVVIDDWR